MFNVYNLYVFIHLVGVFGFLIAHGVSITVGLKLRKERDRDRIWALLQLSGATITWLYVSIALLLAGGILAGFKLHWWSQRWIWTALIVFVLTSGAMLGMARPYYVKIKEKIAYRESGAPQASDEELAVLLMSRRPIVIAWIGFVALAFILYLMVFKPNV